ncbi:Uncharacterized protein PCOAH_00027420 [Plasmodium coatneyi]|uniref:Chromo domain-containing protein n=1 Tax=Plasmodium coatneyi TaxID=208452 RepID=A0A1B1DZV4_9APIC|nr:Uncharacterized protein PCOAH_00027420 [Plasmodium coatneyi]ANQ08175.1 Uncharacterized protein PCOAH_00027420 [Plasmodium coatneyi]
MPIKKGRGGASTKPKKKNKLKNIIDDDYSSELSLTAVGEPDYNEVFEVEKIVMARYKLNVKRKKNRKEESLDNFEFFIKWKNYDSDDNTWEPFENLSSTLKGQARKAALKLTEELEIPNGNGGTPLSNMDNSAGVSTGMVGSPHIHSNALNGMNSNVSMSVMSGIGVNNLRKKKKGMMEKNRTGLNDEEEEQEGRLRGPKLLSNEISSANFHSNNFFPRNMMNGHEEDDDFIKNDSLFKNMSGNINLSNPLNEHYEKNDATFSHRKKLGNIKSILCIGNRINSMGISNKNEKIASHTKNKIMERLDNNYYVRQKNKFNAILQNNKNLLDHFINSRSREMSNETGKSARSNDLNIFDHLESTYDQYKGSMHNYPSLSHGHSLSRNGNRSHGHLHGQLFSQMNSQMASQMSNQMTSQMHNHNLPPTRAYDDPNNLPTESYKKQNGISVSKNVANDDTYLFWKVRDKRKYEALNQGYSNNFAGANGRMGNGDVPLGFESNGLKKLNRSSNNGSSTHGSSNHAGSNNGSINHSSSNHSNMNHIATNHDASNNDATNNITNGSNNSNINGGVNGNLVDHTDTVDQTYEDEFLPKIRCNSTSSSERIYMTEEVFGEFGEKATFEIRKEKVDVDEQEPFISNKTKNGYPKIVVSSDGRNVGKDTFYMDDIYGIKNNQQYIIVKKELMDDESMSTKEKEKFVSSHLSSAKGLESEKANNSSRSSSNCLNNNSAIGAGAPHYTSTTTNSNTNYIKKKKMKKKIKIDHREKYLNHVTSSSVSGNNCLNKLNVGENNINNTNNTCFNNTCFNNNSNSNNNNNNTCIINHNSTNYITINNHNKKPFYKNKSPSKLSSGNIFKKKVSTFKKSLKKFSKNGISTHVHALNIHGLNGTHGMSEKKASYRDHERRSNSREIVYRKKYGTEDMHLYRDEIMNFNDHGEKKAKSFFMQENGDAHPSIEYMDVVDMSKGETVSTGGNVDGSSVRSASNSIGGLNISNACNYQGRSSNRAEEHTFEGCDPYLSSGLHNVNSLYEMYLNERSDRMASIPEESKGEANKCHYEEEEDKKEEQGYPKGKVNFLPEKENTMDSMTKNSVINFMQDDVSKESKNSERGNAIPRHIFNSVENYTSDEILNTNNTQYEENENECPDKGSYPREENFVEMNNYERSMDDKLKDCAGSQVSSNANSGSRKSQQKSHPHLYGLTEEKYALNQFTPEDIKYPDLVNNDQKGNDAISFAEYVNGLSVGKRAMMMTHRKSGKSDVKSKASIKEDGHNAVNYDDEEEILEYVKNVFNKSRSCTSGSPSVNGSIRDKKDNLSGYARNIAQKEQMENSLSFKKMRHTDSDAPNKGRGEEGKKKRKKRISTSVDAGDHMRLKLQESKGNVLFSRNEGVMNNRKGKYCSSDTSHRVKGAKKEGHYKKAHHRTDHRSVGPADSAFGSAIGNAMGSFSGMGCQDADMIINLKDVLSTENEKCDYYINFFENVLSALKEKRSCQADEGDLLNELKLKLASPRNVEIMMKSRNSSHKDLQHLFKDKQVTMCNHVRMNSTFPHEMGNFPKYPKKVLFEKVTQDNDNPKQVLLNNIFYSYNRGNFSSENCAPFKGTNDLRAEEMNHPNVHHFHVGKNPNPVRKTHGEKKGVTSHVSKKSEKKKKKKQVYDEDIAWNVNPSSKTGAQKMNHAKKPKLSPQNMPNQSSNRNSAEYVEPNVKYAKLDALNIPLVKMNYMERYLEYSESINKLALNNIDALIKNMNIINFYNGKNKNSINFIKGNFQVHLLESYTNIFLYFDIFSDFRNYNFIYKNCEFINILLDYVCDTKTESRNFSSDNSLNELAKNIMLFDEIFKLNNKLNEFFKDIFLSINVKPNLFIFPSPDYFERFYLHLGEKKEVAAEQASQEERTLEEERDNEEAHHDMHTEESHTQGNTNSSYPWEDSAANGLPQEDATEEVTEVVTEEVTEEVSHEVSNEVRNDTDMYPEGASTPLLEESNAQRGIHIRQMEEKELFSRLLRLSRGTDGSIIQWENKNDNEVEGDPHEDDKEHAPSGETYGSHIGRKARTDATVQNDDPLVEKEPNDISDVLLPHVVTTDNGSNLFADDTNTGEFNSPSSIQRMNNCMYFDSNSQLEYIPMSSIDQVDGSSVQQNNLSRDDTSKKVTEDPVNKDTLLESICDTQNGNHIRMNKSSGVRALRGSKGEKESSQSDAPNEQTDGDIISNKDEGDEEKDSIVVPTEVGENDPIGETVEKSGNKQLNKRNCSNSSTATAISATVSVKCSAKNVRKGNTDANPCRRNGTNKGDYKVRNNKNAGRRVFKGNAPPSLGNKSLWNDDSNSPQGSGSDNDKQDENGDINKDNANDSGNNEDLFKQDDNILDEDDSQSDIPLISLLKA